METSEIIALLISSSVLSAILTGIINLRIQNLTYKREYYKKIIERRIQAQEKILSLSNELKIQVALNDSLCNRICATGEDHYNSFATRVATSVDISFWLSNDLSSILLDLNIFLLNEITQKLNGDSKAERDECLVNLGILHHEKLREYRKSIDQQLMNDFASMSNIKLFVKSKKQSKDKLYWIKK